MEENRIKSDHKFGAISYYKWTSACIDCSKYIHTNASQYERVYWLIFFTCIIYVLLYRYSPQFANNLFLKKKKKKNYQSNELFRLFYDYSSGFDNAFHTHESDNTCKYVNLYRKNQWHFQKLVCWFNLIWSKLL